MALTRSIATAKPEEKESEAKKPEVAEATGTGTQPEVLSDPTT